MVMDWWGRINHNEISFCRQTFNKVRQAFLKSLDECLPNALQKRHHSKYFPVLYSPNRAAVGILEDYLHMCLYSDHW